MTITQDDLSDLCYEALASAPADWDKIVDKLIKAGDKSLQDSSDALSSIGVLAGCLSVYLGHRGAYGCGDSGHKKALVKAMAKRRALRKAHGYSYP